MTQNSNKHTNIFQDELIQELDEQDLRTVVGGKNPCPTCANIGNNAGSAAKEIRSELNCAGSNLQDQTRKDLETRAKNLEGLSSAIDNALGCIDHAKRQRQYQRLTS